MFGFFTAIDRLLTSWRESKRADEYRSSTDALMRGAAARLKADYVFKGDRHVLTRDGVDVEWTVVHFQGSVQRLIWRATVPPPGFPNFDLRVDRIDSDAPDKRFVFEQLFTPARIERSDHLLRQSELWCENNRLHLRVRPRVVYQTLLDTACELMWELLAVDPYGTSTLRNLGRYHDEAFPYVLVDGPGDIRIGFARNSDRLVTNARSSYALSESAIAVLNALGAAFVQLDGTIELTWPHVVRDRDVLQQAIETLRSGAPRHGVFR